MALLELRQAREQSQEDLARELGVGQPAVAKLERRTDMYVSNLRCYIEALGGSLEITARFPEGGRAARRGVANAYLDGMACDKREGLAQGGNFVSRSSKSEGGSS